MFQIPIRLSMSELEEIYSKVTSTEIEISDIVEVISALEVILKEQQRNAPSDS